MKQSTRLVVWFNWILLFGASLSVHAQDHFLPIETGPGGKDLTDGMGNRLIGYWNFEKGFETEFGETMSFLDGIDGKTAQQAKIGTPEEFKISSPNTSSSKILFVPKCDPEMGFQAALTPHPEGMPKTINQFTIGFQMYYPAETDATWRALLETTVPHIGAFYQEEGRNQFYKSDPDLFINESNGVGIIGGYHGSIPTDRWVWIVFRIINSEPVCLIEKFIDGQFQGLQTIQPSTINHRWCLPIGGGRRIQFFNDDDGETNKAYVNQIVVFSGSLTDQAIRLLQEKGDPLQFNP